MVDTGLTGSQLSTTTKNYKQISSSNSDSHLDQTTTQASDGKL